jgi:uncharacterized protein YjeT (DUF2065 family)
VRDLFAALGLALAIEGLLFAAFPAFVRLRMKDALELGEPRMRIVGLVAAVVGVALVWAARQALG